MHPYQLSRIPKSNYERSRKEMNNKMNKKNQGKITWNLSPKKKKTKTLPSFCSSLSPRHEPPYSPMQTCMIFNAQSCTRTLLQNFLLDND